MNYKLRQFFKNIPLVEPLWKLIKPIIRKLGLENKNPKKIFTDIYYTNRWNDEDSVSGQGSNLEQARALIEKLPVLFKELEVKSILDIPCGDFFWMKEIDLPNIKYIGADIVSELIKNNSEKYQRNSINFKKLNLIEDELPEVDLVMIRDCLVHFSFKDIFLSLVKLCDSGSKYLLTTTFSNRKRNEDIETGKWRTLNLEYPPFRFPPALKLINEKCTLDNGNYSDKCMGLWDIKEIKDLLRISVKD